MKRESESSSSYSGVEPRINGFRLGCGIVVVAFIGAVTVLTMVASRNPFGQKLTDCKLQMIEIGAALERYAVKNDAYPDKLMDLVPDYLPKKLLHCPADPDADSGHISYIYTPVKLNAPDKSVLLSCHFHKFKHGEFERTIWLNYQKNGDVVPINRAP